MTAYCVCVCAEDNAKKKAIAKAKRKPLANCLCLSPSTLVLSPSLSLCCVPNCYRHMGEDFNYSFDALS